jgi:hypothetical protein
MKTRIDLIVLLLGCVSSSAQNTAFTYQGRLNDGANTANGSYDLRFAIFDSATAGAQQGGTLTNPATGVINGLFTATLDFGNQFPGADRWLEISVRTNGAGSFSTVAPRQKLTPSPYAIFAQAANSLSGGVCIGTGSANTISTNFGFGTYSFIGSGQLNWLQADLAAIVSGSQNSASGTWSFTGGGAGNTNNSNYGVIGGGGVNLALGTYDAIGGGYKNTTSGQGSAIPGGMFNSALGNVSFAAGSYAQALHDGTFVWADDHAAPFTSSGANQFLIRASGGVGIGTTNPVAPLHIRDVNAAGESMVLGIDPHAGGYTALAIGLSAQSAGYAWMQAIQSSGSTYGDLLINPHNGNVGIGTLSPSTLLQVGTATCNGSTWQNSSDQALKENAAPVDSRKVLDKVAALPISEWNYRSDSSAKHLGPMAQDFHATFGLNGADDKHISTVDESGVALAAIQGLNQKLTEELRRRDTENAELKSRLSRLERLLEKAPTENR